MTLSRLFSAFIGKRDRIIDLNLGSVSPPPPATRAYVPNHKLVIGEVPGEYATIQVTEQQPPDQMIAAVAVSFPFLKGTWQTPLMTGELRLFAQDIDKVRRSHAGSALLGLAPGALLAIVYFDKEKDQIFFAVDHRGSLGVHVIQTIPLNAADLLVLMDGLQAADPGELTEERGGQIRERRAAARAAPPQMPQPPAGPAVAPHKVVLTIGEEGFTATELDGMLAEVAAGSWPLRREAFVRDLMRRRVLAQEARGRRLDEDPNFKRRLEQSSEQLLAAALSMKLMTTIKPDEAAIQAYYEQHKREFERIKFREILISLNPVRPGRVLLTDAQALAKIQELRNKLLEGAEFVTLAREESDDFLSRSAAVPWTNRVPERAHLKPSASMQAFTLPVGVISEPIRDEQGYHLMLVEAKEQRSFADVRREIEARLRAALTSEAEEELQRRAVVAVDSEYFSWPAPTPDAGETDVEDRTSSGGIHLLSPMSFKTPGSPDRILQDGRIQRIMLLHGPPPVYPTEAKAAGASGHVTLAVVIGKNGTVLDMQPLNGDPMLTAAAMEAVSQWVWRPTISNGMTVEVATRIEFEFAVPK